MACHCKDCDLENEEEKEEKEEEEESRVDKILTTFSFLLGVACLITGFILSKTDPIYSDFTWSVLADTNFYQSKSFGAFILYTVGYIPLLLLCFKNSIEEIKEGEYINEYTLMIVATIGAYAIGEFPECLFVLLFAIIGNWLETYATSKSKKSIKKLVNSMPLYAHYVQEDGNIIEKEPQELSLHDLIEIRPGEKIPVDGVIVKGKSSLDLSSINGESLPKDVEENTLVYSGSVNLESVIVVEVLKEFKDSTLSKIMELVEKQQKNKAKSEKFITKFAKYYTPTVIVIALLAFLIGFGLSNWSWDAGGRTSLFNALSILLISCPCALVISVPIAFFAGIGVGSKNGILIKGSVSLEKLAKTKTFVFDKTGTLTTGNFKLISNPNHEALQIAASLESKSTHPLAKAVCEDYKGEYLPVENFTNVPGKGIKGSINNTNYLIGTKDFLVNNNVSNIKEVVSPFKVLYLGVENGDFLESFIVSDTLKDNSKGSFAALKEQNVDNLIILSGDEEGIVKQVGEDLGATEALGSLLPDEKLEHIQKWKENKNLVSFVGDGINDSPSLLASDIGISMGSLGSDAAIEASDVVITDDNLMKIPEAKRLAKRTLWIVKLCIAVSILLKILFMVLVLAQVLGPWAMIISAVSDTGVMVICVLIAISLLTYKPKYKAQTKTQN